MTLNKIHPRFYRPFWNNEYNRIDYCSAYKYIHSKHYANNPLRSIRFFKIIEKELDDIYSFIEPSALNFKTFSIKIRNLLAVTCMEIEANLKAIIGSNANCIETIDRKIGAKTGKLKQLSKLTINDYKVINKTHKLSDYVLKMPLLDNVEFRPFESWLNKEDEVPLWWTAYNKSKHDAISNIEFGNLENLINAIGALLILIYSQFGEEDFSIKESVLSLGMELTPFKGLYSTISSFFLISALPCWNSSECYDASLVTGSITNDYFEEHRFSN